MCPDGLGKKKIIQRKNTQGFDGLWATSPAWQAGFCNRRLVRENSAQFFVCSGSLSKTVRNGRTHKLFEARQLSRTNPRVSANSMKTKRRRHTNFSSDFSRRALGFQVHGRNGSNVTTNFPSQPLRLYVLFAPEVAQGASARHRASRCLL